MGYFRSLVRSLLGIKAEMSPGLLFSEQRAPVFTPRQYDKLSREGYEKNVIAYKCVNELCNSISSIEWFVQVRSTGKPVEDPGHWLVKLLNKPNIHQTFGDFLFRTTAFYLIAGNTYWEKVRVGGGGPPRQLQVPRPDRMKVLKGKLGVEGYLWEDNRGNKRTWEADPLTGESDISHQCCEHVEQEPSGQ
jgi:phage portal protein BeeE